MLPQVSYSAGDKDFSRALRQAGYHRPAPDVYYLPGARAESAAILEEMKAQKTFGAVLGSSEWNGAEFPVEVSAASTVLVPCRFLATSTEGATAEFVRTLKSGYQREPDAYAALGYDAGLVIIDALMRGGNLAERVGTTKLLPGASGRLTARAWSVAGQVTLLRLKGKSFEFDSVIDIK
jgi:branched-chain amino acid transport system substrate-binding protein